MPSYQTRSSHLSLVSWEKFLSWISFNFYPMLLCTCWSDYTPFFFIQLLWWIILLFKHQTNFTFTGWSPRGHNVSLWSMAGFTVRTFCWRSQHLRSWEILVYDFLSLWPLCQVLVLQLCFPHKMSWTFFFLYFLKAYLRVSNASSVFGKLYQQNHLDLGFFCRKLFW